jgi:hypothetical protein
MLVVKVKRSRNKSVACKLTWVLLNAVTKSLFVTLYKTSSNLAESVRDASANRAAAKDVSEIVAVRDSVKVNNLQKAVALELRGAQAI